MLAGISGPTAPVKEMNPDDWEKVVQVNLNGTFNVTRLAIPHKKSSAGVIINMSSIAGRFGYADRSPYSTTKWGIVGFTKTLSIELGEFGIRANTILPGAVASLVGLAVFFLLIRQQSVIGDAGPIPICEKAPIQDSEIKRLCTMIISSQQSEIDQIKAIMARLEK